MRPRTITRTSKLLRQDPLPLGDLVTAIQRDPALTSLVLRAAARERRSLPPDLETSVVLLGAEGLRAILGRAARTRKLKGKAGRASAGPASHPDRKKLRELKKALAADRYRVDPRSVAAAMLHELKRS